MLPLSIFNRHTLFSIFGYIHDSGGLLMKGAKGVYPHVCILPGIEKTLQEVNWLAAPPNFEWSDIMKLSLAF